MLRLERAKSNFNAPSSYPRIGEHNMIQEGVIIYASFTSNEDRGSSTKSNRGKMWNSRYVLKGYET